MIDLVKIAHIGSSQGKAGALKFYPEEHLEEITLGLDFIFIMINGSKVPFKVKKINHKNNPWLLFIDQIDGPEKAQQFTNEEVFAERDLVGNTEIVSDETMKGFKIFSEEGDSFGIVLETEEHPQQILLVVEFNSQQFRIPFHPDLIAELDKENQKIRYNYTKDDFEMLFN